ncbi:MAG: DUF4830 domain-containing protein [Ruminococcaceae bacterium]|nr:DUF4830 domain-containing protein [Oscillospiraceae bacterium]
MNTYITFTKKRLFLIFSLVLCVGFVFCKIAAVSNLDTDAMTNSDRLVFIKDLGYTVINNEPVTKTVNIPEKFYDVYKNYNVLQQQANYDLSLYKGCEATIYTYNINPPAKYTGEWVVNLIVYHNRIIGGDASSTEFGGNMLPLKKQSE